MNLMNISIIIGISIIAMYIILSFLIKDTEKKNKTFLIFAFVFLFIILYLRNPYSDLKYFIANFKVYGGNFANISKDRYAILYKILCIIIGKISLEERFFVSVIDLITLIGPFFIIKKYSKNYLLSILLFVALGTYEMQFYVIRQALSISFLLLSIKYIEENKIIKYLFLVIIAGLFHHSAFIFLPMYYLSYLKVSKDKIIVWITLFALIFVFRRNIALLLLNSTEYSSYIGGKYDVIGEGQWKLILYILFFCFCLLFKKGFINSKISSIFLSFMLVCIGFQLIATAGTSFVRVANYFSFPFYLLPVNLTETIKDRRTRLIVKTAIILFYFMFVFLWNPINGYSIRF